MCKHILNAHIHAFVLSAVQRLGPDTSYTACVHALVQSSLRHYLKFLLLSINDAKVARQHQICDYRRSLLLYFVILFSLQHLSHVAEATDHLLTLTGNLCRRLDLGERVGREEGENSVAPTRVISGGCWGVLGVGGDVSSALSIWKSFVHTCQPLCNLLARRFCSCGFVGTRNARGVGAYHVGLSDQRHVRARARRGEGW